MREKGQDMGDMQNVAGERIAKYLARAGVASRRECERLIEAGRIKVNGKVLTTPAFKVTAKDKILFDNNAVAKKERPRLWLYHKPVGLITAHKDPQGRPTVFENLPKTLPRVISVGRLDLNSEGLLLLTNDGELARALELPSTGWARRYRARAFGSVTQEELDRLKEGIDIDGIPSGPIEAELDKQQRGNAWITVTIREGKNREVRRALDMLGLKVNRLIRTSYGPFKLGNLERAQVEEIKPRILRDQVGHLIDIPKIQPQRYKPHSRNQKPHSRKPNSKKPQSRKPESRKPTPNKGRRRR